LLERMRLPSPMPERFLLRGELDWALCFTTHLPETDCTAILV
jgi:hypothetical protein